jgi:hypothetical protein
VATRALAQREACPAVHLALDHLDLVDGGFGDSGVPGRSQGVADGVVVRNQPP